MSEIVIPDGSTVVFIGDSITDCGRRGGEAPLGGGFVKWFVDLVLARHPDRRHTWINKGISGNKITDLSERWADDVIRHKPDWLVVKIGINDLHAYLRGDAQGVSPETYRAHYRRILTAAKEEFDPELVLIDPFYISRSPAPESFRRKVLDTLPEYLAVTREMAETFGARHLKTHVLFQEHLARRESEVFCPEPIHPNRTGHLVIAEALYRLLSR